MWNVTVCSLFVCSVYIVFVSLQSHPTQISQSTQDVHKRDWVCNEFSLAVVCDQKNKRFHNNSPNITFAKDA